MPTPGLTLHLTAPTFVPHNPTPTVSMFMQTLVSVRTFPPLPRDPHDLEFELSQRLQLRADIFRGKEGKASSTVATILGGKKEKRSQVAVGIELPEREWVPVNAPLVGDGK